MDGGLKETEKSDDKKRASALFSPACRNGGICFFSTPRQGMYPATGPHGDHAAGFIGKARRIRMHRRTLPALKTVFRFSNALLIPSEERSLKGTCQRSLSFSTHKVPKTCAACRKSSFDRLRQTADKVRFFMKPYEAAFVSIHKRAAYLP